MDLEDPRPLFNAIQAYMGCSYSSAKKYFSDIRNCLSRELTTAKIGSGGGPPTIILQDLNEAFVVFSLLPKSVDPNSPDRVLATVQALAGYFSKVRS